MEWWESRKEAGYGNAALQKQNVDSVSLEKSASSNGQTTCAHMQAGPLVRLLTPHQVPVYTLPHAPEPRKDRSRSSAQHVSRSVMRRMVSAALEGIPCCCSYCCCSARSDGSYIDAVPGMGCPAAFVGSCCSGCDAPLPALMTDDAG